MSTLIRLCRVCDPSKALTKGCEEKQAAMGVRQYKGYMACYWLKDKQQSVLQEGVIVDRIVVLRGGLLNKSDDTDVSVDERKGARTTVAMEPRRHKKR